jgi:hypothetical protein
MDSPKSSQTKWHHELGKLYLCEELVDRFNCYLACPQCCKDLAANPPIPEQPTHAFVRNSGGKAPLNTTRRIWGCRIASKPQRVISCRKFGVTEMINLCLAQLTVSKFDEAVQAVQACYDINREEYRGLRSCIVTHQQRLEPSHPSPRPASPLAVHVQPAKIDLWDSDPPTSKRKAGDATGDTPTKASRHARYNRNSRDLFSPSPPPLSRSSEPTLPSLVRQAFKLQAQISRHAEELATAQAQLRSILQGIETQTSILSTPPDSFASTPSSTPPLPTSSVSSSSTIAVIPPGKGKNRNPVELTWIYAGCLLPEANDMSTKKVYDLIMQEAAKVYEPEELKRIIWARQLDDDDWTVELTVYKADVHRLYEIGRAKFEERETSLDLSHCLRDLHNPCYWSDFLAATPTMPTTNAADMRALIRQHDVRRLAEAFEVCDSKLVRRYLTRLCEAWGMGGLLYDEVGAYRERTGMKFPDPS